MPRLAAAGALRGTVADGYFRDIGVPDDFARAADRNPARCCTAAPCSSTATAC